MTCLSGDQFQAKQEVTLVDNTITKINNKLIVTSPGVLQLQKNILYQTSKFTQIYQPLPNQYIIGILVDQISDGWLVDIGTSRNALIPKSFTSKQTFIQNNYIYCKVLNCYVGEQTVLKYEDASCFQLFRNNGMLLNISPSNAVNLSLDKQLQLEIAKRVQFQLLIGLNGRIFVQNCDSYDQYSVITCLKKKNGWDLDLVQQYLIDRERAKLKGQIF